MSNKESFKTAIVFNDIHFPNEDKKAVNVLLKTVEQIVPDIVVANGDIVDWETFSRHDRFKAPKCHWTDSDYYSNSKKEYDSANSFLEKLNKLLKPKTEKYWLLSNHDDWILSFIEESPKTREQMFGLESRLGLSKGGWKVLEYNKLLKLGKLNITHGIYAGSNPAKKHLQAVFQSVIFGHVHSMEVASHVTAGKETVMAWANGCLLDMSPKYMRNRPQNWSHGFSIVYFFKNGDFQVNQIRIEKGRAIVNGKLVQG